MAVRPRSRLALAVAPMLVLALLPEASPSEEPALELHRTEEGRHIDPARTNPLFVLVIGSDIREGNPAHGRADSLQIVAVNTDTGRGTIVGIPRDSYVPIPGRGNGKINSSLRFGGPELTVETVRQLSGLPIHYWAIVDFSRFRSLVDHLGGLTVDVPYPLADPKSGAFFEPGPRHMNGHELLAFARVRQGVPGGDFGRQQKIGQVLHAGLGKFQAEAASPAGLVRYLEEFRGLVVSNVPVRDLLHLATVSRRIEHGGMQVTVVPGSTGQAGGMSIVHLAPEAQAIFSSIRVDAEL